ncbi:MAG TPA: hypothetical protein VN702_05720, partial [Acetobacteraceae bacterium]|nr:hypothetical protein [Acetobacteraceae bacterium]
YEAAVVAGRAVTQMNPSLSAGFKPYLAALGHLNRAQEAAVARRRLLVLEPDFTVERFLASSPLEREADRQLFSAGLRLAGIPDR